MHLLTRGNDVLYEYAAEVHMHMDVILIPLCADLKHKEVSKAHQARQEGLLFRENA